MGRTPPNPRHLLSRDFSNHQGKCKLSLEKAVINDTEVWPLQSRNSQPSTFHPPASCRSTQLSTAAGPRTSLEALLPVPSALCVHVCVSQHAGPSPGPPHRHVHTCVCVCEYTYVYGTPPSAALPGPSSWACAHVCVCVCAHVYETPPAQPSPGPPHGHVHV